MRCSNWSRGSNSKGNILSSKAETEYSGADLLRQETGNVNPVNMMEANWPIWYRLAHDAGNA